MTHYNLSQFQYSKTYKVLSASSEMFAGEFPEFIDIFSERTHRMVRFVQDFEKAIQREFWDGEMMEYIPTEPLKNVARLVIQHQW